MEEKGYFVVLMERMFGKSWQTSFYGLLAFLVEATTLVQTYLVDMGVPDKVIHSVAAIFALIAIMHAKSNKVTGGTVVQPSSPDAVAANQVAPKDAPAKNEPTKP